jgi:hypothetical protein
VDVAGEGKVLQVEIKVHEIEDTSLTVVRSEPSFTFFFLTEENIG